MFLARVRGRWEKDLQHVVFKGQGEDTGIRSTSVSIGRSPNLPRP